MADRQVSGLLASLVTSCGTRPAHALVVPRGSPAFCEDHGLEILDCLKKYGQRLDLEIAEETGLPLASVRRRLADLSATGEVITCTLTRFENGERIDAWECRVAGYVPPRAPGRRPMPKP